MSRFDLKELRSEFRRINWPDPKELAQKSLIVIVFCAVLSLIIGAYDWVFVSLRELIQGLFGL
ncbi:MAG: preprotein translocase subunit SecE [Firmicutes bacterium]|nr:preprotein translocase subunit SecE [Bacillota bacterium]